MEKEKKKKRKPPISYRPPVALREAFYQCVEESGLPVSGFITRLFQLYLVSRPGHHSKAQSEAEEPVQHEGDRQSVIYCPPEALREEFFRRVEKSKQPVSDYITRLFEFYLDAYSKRRVRRPPVEKKLLVRILGELAAIRDELRLIAKRDDCDCAQLLERVDTAVGLLLDIRGVLFKFLGRKP